MGWVKGAVLGVTVSLVLAGVAGAQESNETLKKEVEALKAKVEALEKDASTKPPAAPAAAAAPQAGEQPMEGNWLLQAAERLIKDIKLSGFVDVGFIYNLDRPDTGVNGNTGDSTIPPGPPSLDGGSVRAFDRESRAFYLHNAQVSLGRAPTKDLITGFYLELSLGSDANVIAPVGTESTDYFDIQEAYVNILLPFEKGIDLKVGKFATLSGYEVIESKDNYNYSRSLPFLFAIPFTHTGVRASYQAHDQVKVTLGVNNGWDLLEDINDGKTLEFQVAVTPIEWLAVYGTLYYGAEKSAAQDIPNGKFTNRDPGDKRMLIDIVAVATNPGGIQGLTLGFNFDWAEEEDSAVSTSGQLEDAEWTAWAVYAKYQVNEWFAPSIRISSLDDDDGFRAGTLDNRITEFTLTGEFKISADTIVRVEVRQDSADEDIFLDKSKEEDSQVTLGAEVIFTF